MRNLLITICARGGSKGVKGKNIRDLAGFPLIYYTINQAKVWGKSKYIVVSTDSVEIVGVAKKYGAQVPFIRPKKFASDTTPKSEAIKHALLESEKFFKKTFDYVMDLDATAPIRKIEDLENAFKLFLEQKPKTLFSVVKARRNPYFNMVEENKEGRVHLSKKGNFARRQDAPKVYDMNASIYIYSRDYLLNERNNKPVTNDSIIYEMDEISRTDIDSEIDFKYIEFLVKEKIVTL
ncbi:MAG: acylneuraminate cytidylyltransferase family protein [Candidatus Daviesbacteria bacterium]|nr:acylneuraminate cytidylyltransferase family protein [Candidatus Daviesbacteria bacterium]